MKRTKFILFSAFALLVIIFLFFRLYDIDKRIIFDWDQEFLSYEVKKIINNHDLTLLGPRTTNDKGFFLGPFFTYVLIPFFVLTKMHPSALIWLIILYNILFILAGLYIFKRMTSPLFAFMFFLLWAINPLLIKYDTTPWWPLLIPFLTIVLWYFLFRLKSKPARLRNWAIIGAVSGFLMNLHFQAIFLILFILFFLIIDKSLRKHINLIRITLMGLSCAFFMFPLLIFDLKHGFFNSRLFLDFFFSGTGTESTNPLNWLPVFTNLLYPILHVKSDLLTFGLYILFVPVIIFLIYKKERFYNAFYKATLFLWLLFPILFAIYGKRPSEYYFVFIYPFILFTLTDFFITVKKKMILILLTFVLFTINIGEIRSLLFPHYLSLYKKELAIKKLKKITLNFNKKYNLSYDIPLFKNTGYRYLVEYYDIKASGNSADPLVEIRIPSKENDIIVGEIGLKIPEELKK